MSSTKMLLTIYSTRVRYNQFQPTNRHGGYRRRNIKGIGGLRRSRLESTEREESNNKNREVHVCDWKRKLRTFY